ncbi:hypothetical protein [Rhizobium leguminosarum]|uniref:hypothetical protein n=1 Tax=Rhizobium leguminosarum TaxID=384 RepID=UPI001031834D|nr:hypothetical protein [Rhizobium leguminosarum]TAV44986.1 hypothetical protein ELI29_29975 [Rhizobium leguminosarum]
MSNDQNSPLGNASVEASLKNTDSSSDNSRTEVNVLTGARIHQGDNSSVSVAVSTLGRKFRSQPWWVQVGAAIILMIMILVLYEVIDIFIVKRGNFYSAMESGINENKSQFMSSSNVIFSTLPNNIIPENGPQQWSAISKLWVRAGDTFEQIYEGAAKCIDAGTCIAGNGARKLCEQAVGLNAAYDENLERLKQITGITINMAPGNSMAPFGENVVDVPLLNNLPKVASHCHGHGFG